MPPGFLFLSVNAYVVSFGSCQHLAPGADARTAMLGLPGLRYDIVKVYKGGHSSHIENPDATQTFMIVLFLRVVYDCNDMPESVVSS